MQHYLYNQDSRQFFQAAETQSELTNILPPGLSPARSLLQRQKPASLDGHFFKVAFFYKKNTIFFSL
jgi:hypothetical protein